LSSTPKSSKLSLPFRFPNKNIVCISWRKQDNNEILIRRCRILFEKMIVTQPVNKYPAFFMEPEGSLPCSQKPATGPSPEPANSSSSRRSQSS
jgi:hypothetical protein